MPEFLHARRDFGQLVRVVADELRVDPVLVEKDYWLMHCLWGLQAQGLRFELKGGTSLSKGFRIIHRFSEDIDVRIEPPASLEVKTGRNQDKAIHIESRRSFYDWLATELRIPGIVAAERDTAFDDEKMRSGGIRLEYPSTLSSLRGVKPGVLLEVGFDDTAPNRPVTISSWAYDAAAARGVSARDNRALDVPCYEPSHTFVEKLQALSTKYRGLPKTGRLPPNFLRHYYDIYCLLAQPEVLAFIGTPEYEARKRQRFRSADEIVIARNPAFILRDRATREVFAAEYTRSAALYYQGQPPFEDVLGRIREHVARL